MLRIVVGRAAVLLLSAGLSTFAGAAAQRTFVASSGNDAHPCSLLQPCRAFAAAIAQATSGGEVIVLDSAGYGPVTITKAISLIAPAGVYAGITVFNGDGVTVNAPGAIVVLRGLSINGQGGSNGVNVLQAARVRIENCVISKMAVDGVMHSATGAELIVLDTIVRDNGGSGIGGDADASVVLDHVRSEHNGTNGFYMASLVQGLQARAIITESIFAFNGSNGVWVASTNGGNTLAQIDRSVLADNVSAGLKISAAATGVIVSSVTRNTVHGNAGNGVVVIGPGYAQATVAENAIGGGTGGSVGLYADGGDTHVFASANILLSGLALGQANGAEFFTNGNNIGTAKFGTIQPGTTL